MKLTIAAATALAAGSLISFGTASATGLTAQVASTCHLKPSPREPYIAKNALQAVQFVSPTTGWVAGANRVLATTDGGAHWSLQRSQKHADYTEVDAIDAHHVWIVGRHQLIRTTNGGRTWQQLPEHCAVISSVHFVSPSRGFAVAGGKLLKTGDGGRRWHAVSAPARVQSVCFYNTHLGWLGAQGKIYRTVNAGRVWALAVAGPPVHKVGNEPFAAVQCAGPDAGWAELIGPGVASNQEAHIAYHLSDSGSRPIFAEQYFEHPHVTVKRESPGAYYAAFSSVDAADAVFVDTCTPCGRGTSPIGIVTNQGQSMTAPRNVGHLNFALGAAFVSTAQGWVVGNVQHYHAHTATWKIVHTVDGGRHWTTQYVE
jgi:hypothetical protein